MKKLFLILLMAFSIFAQDTLKIATSLNFPPFEYMKNGEYIGFNIDLVNEIGKVLNKKIEFVPMDFDAVIVAIKSGKIDASPNMSETPERAKSVDFSIPYFSGMNYYVKLKDNKKLNSLKDLEKGAVIGARLGTLQADEISKIKGVTPYLNPENIVFVLATLGKKIDGFILENSTAKRFIKDYPQLEVFAQTKPNTKGVCFALKKGNTKLKSELDKAIEILKSNGTYQKLLEKHELN